VIDEPIADVVLIVGFRNPDDVTGRLAALSNATSQPSFDVFICENGGARFYQQLLSALLDPYGPCENVWTGPRWPVTGVASSTCGGCGCARGRHRMSASDAPPKILDTPARDQYDHLQHLAGWKGMWILNPDTDCLGIRTLSRNSHAFSLVHDAPTCDANSSPWSLQRPRTIFRPEAAGPASTLAPPKPSIPPSEPL
jgi:hypothetical protein